MAEWKSVLAQQVGETVLSADTQRGGDFADAFQVRLSSGRHIFVKTHRQGMAGFFVTEAAGLQWLRDTHTVRVPQVLALSDEPPLLALEWIERGRESGTTEPEFGRQLAALHSTTSACFGRPDERSTGSQGMPNSLCESWADFYASQRLLPLARIASARGALPEKLVAQAESVAARLAQLGVPEEAPALLHGDLWAGNRVIDNHGQSWLIDAAAHYGHREFDLAMMHLFGGFSDACFVAYNEVTPLATGFSDRIALHQLAPLMVHAIKFGGHYVNATAEALRRYQ